MAYEDIYSVIARLRMPSTEKRLRAAAALGKLEDKRAFEPLVIALTDEDPGVRAEAARSLGMLKDSRAEPPLIAMLAGEHTEVISNVMHALAELMGSRAIPLLIEQVLGDRDPWRVEEGAVEALLGTLVGIGDKSAIDPLVDNILWHFVDDNYLLDEVFNAVIEIDEDEAVDTLARSLRSRQYVRVHEATIEVWGELGNERAVEPLIDKLRSSSEETRGASAQALAKLGDDRAIIPLLAQLHCYPYSSADDVETEAIDETIGHALWDLGVPLEEDSGQKSAIKSPVDILVTALQHEDSGVRERAATALGNTGDLQAVNPLIQALADEDPAVCWEVAQALRKMRDELAVKPLTDFAKRDEGWAKIIDATQQEMRESKCSFYDALDRAYEDFVDERRYYG